MRISYSPPSTSQRLVRTLKYRKVYSSKGMVTVLLSPAFRRTRVKPFSSAAGRKICAPGRPTYSWAISSPSRSPALVRVKVAPLSVTLRPLYTNRV